MGWLILGMVIGMFATAALLHSWETRKAKKPPIYRMTRNPCVIYCEFEGHGYLLEVDKFSVYRIVRDRSVLVDIDVRTKKHITQGYVAYHLDKLSEGEKFDA